MMLRPYLIALALALASWLPLDAQQVCTQTRTTRVLKNQVTRVGADSVYLIYVTQDSTRGRCKLSTGRTDTVRLRDTLRITDTLWRDPVPPPPPPPVDTTPTPPSNPTYPNRPANYTRVLSEYGFGDVVPNGREVPVGGGWGSSWNDAGLMRRGSQADAPVSPSSVLEWAFTRTGTRSGEGVGNLGRGLPTGVNQVYVAFWIKHDPQFEFHPISNKLLYLEPGNVILQTRMWASNWFTINGASGEYRATNYTLPLGQWVQVEYLVDAVNKRIKLWVDGRLVVDVADNLAGNFRELKLDSTWGGASGTKTRDSFRWIDHILVATP